jgi:hypothetical protein
MDKWDYIEDKMERKERKELKREKIKKAKASHKKRLAKEKEVRR